jgi:peptidoglycan hydrolase-like protein with peptidoglycan-binding domain
MKNTFKIIAIVFVLTLVTIDIASAATGYNGRSGSRLRKFEPTPPLVQQESNSTKTIFCTLSDESLKEGDAKPAVICLQEGLRVVGFFTYPVSTGYFGSITLKSVQDFQIAKGIVSSGTPETTGFGLFGPRTRQALKDALSV